jgi:hypothetical protein
MRATIRDFRIVPDKASSRLMRFIAAVLRPFVPTFMTHFATTIGAVMYIPLAWWVYASVLARVSCHEWVHELRAMGADIVLGPDGATVRQRGSRETWVRRVWWSWLYLFPQSLAPLALLSILAWPFGAWWLLWLVALITLAPWPAPFRAREELAAYVVTLRLTAPDSRAGRRAEIIDSLTGWSYYRAAWRRNALAAQLLEAEAWPCAEARFVLAQYARIRGELRGE